MKPRIIKYMGIWHCGIACGGQICMGLGYTTALAYADWALLAGLTA